MKLLRLLRIAPLALLFAGVAFAQTTGTIIGVVTDASTGKPVAGAVIVARSPNLQGEQTAVTDANGNYRITLLPPGAYSLAVQLEGFKPAERSDITMRADKTIRANIAVVPEAVQMEEQVVRTGAAPVVNIGAAESGAVVSREFMANIPVGRSVENVAEVVPTAQADTYGVSFAGAQSPENSYIVDGLNVTDPVYGTFAGNPNSQTLTPTLQNNFVQEIDVKTGGFQPEYGRTTGGVLNVVTRSGSNEYHGSVFTDFTPRMLVDPTGRNAGTNGEAIGWRRKPDEGAFDLDFGFEVGGPIMKDKLWFYAGFAPIVTRTYTERFLQMNQLDGAGNPVINGSTGLIVQDRVAGTEQVYRSGRTTYQYVGKLTYLLDENNNLTLSAVGMPTSATSISMAGSPSRRTFDETGNTFDGSLRYAGKFLDKRLIVEAQAGWHYNTSAPKDKTQAGVDQLNTPTLQFQFYTPVTNFEALDACTAAGSMDARCPVSFYNIGGLGYLSDATSNRLATRVSASYLSELLGSHNTKVGVDFERSTFAQDKRYAGGYYYATRGDGLIYTRRGYGYVTTPNGRIGLSQPRNPDGTYPLDGQSTIPSEVVFASTVKNTAGTNSTSVYAQDSWQLPQNVTLNYGIRWEGQSLNNVSNPDSNGFTINNSWAPRVQAIWDFTGSGRGKVAGSWGRFFYAMPLDLGDRTFGAERSLIYYMPTSAQGGAPGCAIPGGADAAVMANPANQNLVNYDTRQLSPSACGVTNWGGNAGGSNRSYLFRTSGTAASPVSPDISQAYVDQFGGQIEYEVLSDLSVGLEYAGRRQGDIIEDMSPNDGEGYYIGNPTKGGEFVGSDGVTYNPSAPTATDTATGRLMVIPFPKPERSYDGITASVRKNFSRGWQASASYTYSVLRGNYAGPYRPEDGQLDPGITSVYDIPSIMTNQKGYLAGDRPHQIKLYGSYTWAASPRFSLTGGAAYTGMSGTPVSALAGYNELYDVSQTFVVPRGMGGRTPWTNKVDLRGALEYVIKPPYALKFTVDVFNVFNSEEIIAIDQDYTYDAAQPITGANCSSKTSAGKGNPVAALQSACPDLKYLKTIDGRPVTVNPNWGRPAAGTASFLAPLSLRLGLALSF
jgi:outer membrane receptor protein involved in Fe transport